MEKISDSKDTKPLSENQKPLYSLVPMSCEWFLDNRLDSLRENHEEVSHFEFFPDVAIYETMEKAGAGLYLALFKEETPIGHAFLVSMKDLHSKNITRARVESVFIEKEHRSLKAFRFIVTEIERLLKTLRVDTVSFTSNRHKPIGKILERFAYQPEEVVYTKELSDGN